MAVKMHTLLRAMVQLLILRSVPHFHPRDVKMRLVNDLFNILCRRGLGSPSPRSALSCRGVALPASALAPFREGPHFCRGLRTWTPLKDRVLSVNQ